MHSLHLLRAVWHGSVLGMAVQGHVFSNSARVCVCVCASLKMHKLVGARGRLVATEHRRPLLGVAERSVAGRGLMRSAFAGSRTLREHRASEPAHRASSRNTSATGDEPAARVSFSLC